MKGLDFVSVPDDVQIVRLEIEPDVCLYKMHLILSTVCQLDVTHGHHHANLIDNVSTDNLSRVTHSQRARCR